MKPKKLGHLVLRVRDLVRSEAFYTDVLGLRVTGRIPGRMTFFSSGEDSHDLAIARLGEDAPGPDPLQVGLYHFAYQVNTADELKAWHWRLKENGVRIVGSADHGVSHSLYFLDPDGIEVELTYEVPPDQWPKDRNPFAGREPLALEERVEVKG